MSPASAALSSKPAARRRCCCQIIIIFKKNFGPWYSIRRERKTFTMQYKKVPYSSIGSAKTKWLFGAWNASRNQSPVDQICSVL